MNNEKDNNSVNDLTSMMFKQMQRLSDPELDLDKEIKRSQAISSAGTVIINAAKVQIDAQRVKVLQQKAAAIPAKDDVLPKELGSGS